MVLQRYHLLGSKNSLKMTPKEILHTFSHLKMLLKPPINLYHIHDHLSCIAKHIIKSNTVVYTILENII